MNNHRKIEKYAVIQQDSSDCGAACLVSVIRYFGGNSTIETIRKMSGTTQYGTTMLGLYQSANKLGIIATGYEASINDIKNNCDILILHVTSEERLDHYVVKFGYEREKFIIWDPAKGLLNMSEEELGRFWVSNKCLDLKVGNNFRSEKDNSNNKRKWLIRAIKPEKDILIISMVIGILISGLGLVMAMFTQKLIDKILPSKEPKVLLLASILVLILLSSRIILSSIRQHFLLLQGKTFNIRIVDEFFKALLFLPKSFFDTRRTGDFVARLNDTMRIQRVIAEITGIYIIDILILIVTIIALFYYSSVAAIVSLLCLPVFYLLVFRWNKRIISAQNSLMAGYAMSDSNFINSLKGIFEIKSLNWQEEFSSKNNVIYSEFQERAFQMGNIKIKLGLLTGLTGNIYIIVILIFSSIQVMKSNLTQGELMAILSLSSSLIPSVLNLALVSIPVSEAKVAINRMFEFSQVESEEKNSLKSWNDFGIHSLSLRNISFRFPGQKLLLNNISLSIEKGKIISLVGESGCGKSTLANIIMKFYDPEIGEITVNENLNSNQIQLNIWRSKVGIVGQEINIFNGTLLQNLIADCSERNIDEALTIVSKFGLNEFVDGFPSGLMTIIGEEGINLSGGQKQLLAFLRALIKKPDILIIDEGTSNMDHFTEKLILDLLVKLKVSMGILLITHRINLIRRLSDHIYIIDDKIIKEEGTHAELITKDNIYKRFWQEYY